MLKHCYLLILFVFFLASCAPNDTSKSPVSAEALSYKSTTQYKQLTPFNRVEVQGQINVTLHTGYKKPQVILRGDPRDLAKINAEVSENTFYLSLGKGYPHHGAVHADIRGQFLNSFTYEGIGLVDGSQLHSAMLDLYLVNNGTTKLAGSLGLRRLDIVGKGLTVINGINSQNLQINLKGNPKVLLTGVANISNLIVDGSTWFSLYWLKSDVLTIRGKNKARIQLAGTVNKLDVELWGNAYFKGRFLRAQRSFVKTHGHSVAEISSVNHQSTLATDRSNIYYYNLSNTREDFMAYKGSVLDMREWDRSNLRDFDRYNKQFP
ncbi:GIN domain-containing protein [Legionella sp.]|uniref:GIN domain-containing protein n=1 Tax=Legionella sp. TaxID=459 RepID=UPI003CB63DCF